MVHHPSRSRRDAEIRQFHAPLFRRQDVGPFDVSVYHTLIVEVEETFEDLINVNRDQGFGYTTELLEDRVEGAILAIFEDDVKEILALDETPVLYDVRVCQIALYKLELQGRWND